LGSARDLRNAALWLCEAEEGKHQFSKDGQDLQSDGWTAVTNCAKRWKEATENGGKGRQEDMDWVRPFSWLATWMQVLLIQGYPVNCSAQDTGGQYARSRFVSSWACALGYEGW